MKRTALIVGGTGVAGRALLAHLTSLDDWDVIGVSRRRPDFQTRARWIEADLHDEQAARAQLGGLKDVTHLFYTAYVDAPSFAEQRAPNSAMLVNAVEAIAAAGGALEHVCLLQGTKYYGSHLGPFRTPAREDDARPLVANFYYDQQDHLERRGPQLGFSYSCARPHVICGFALGTPMNLIAALGAYAAICKELGLPLRYPGKPGAFRTIYQATDAGLLARAMTWMATAPACRNEAFNVTNGDFFRYENLWPKLADFFEMKTDEPRQTDLVSAMADKAPLWEAIVARHGLAATPFGKVADWRFANYVWSNDWDVMSSTLKCRQAGFLEFIDTEEMFVRVLGAFRTRRIIP